MSTYDQERKLDFIDSVHSSSQVPGAQPSVLNYFDSFRTQ